MGYQFRSLDGADGYLFEVSDGARRAFFSAGPGSPYALNRTNAAAVARDKAFAQEVLSAHGLPTIPSQLFFTSDRYEGLRDPGREPSDARAFAETASYPFFCKPIDAAQGAFAEIIRDAAQFARYLERVAPKHYAVLVQPIIRAPEHRVFVLEGRVLFAYRKSPPRLIADGAATLTALFTRVRDTRRPDELSPPASEALRGVDEHGASYKANEIPPEGAAITLEGAANRALGGRAESFTTEAPRHLADLALQAAAALNLQLAAIDLFDHADGPLIIEANANPAIKTLEDQNRWDLIETIWRANFAAALR